MHVLMISPVPSHPQHQGNSARIFEMGRALQMLGATIHFVYVAFEGCDEEMRQSMSASWEKFETIEVSIPLNQSTAECYLLDDWYEPQLDEALKNIYSLYDFDIVLTTYVWMSRSFLLAPKKCYRILDAQDIFGDRHKRLLEHGVAPAWFYTSSAEEARGLKRADCILAIQEDEAADFRKISATRVEVLGHLVPARFLPPSRPSERIKIGYIGSGNPTNIDSMNKFCAEFIARAQLIKRFDIIAAGPICDAVLEDFDLLNRIGRVKDVADFYKKIDIVVNPNMGGSGLKIKSVEALSYGRPLIATVDAMLGIKTNLSEHNCRNSIDICDILENMNNIKIYTENTQKVFRDYQKQQYDSIEKIFGIKGIYRSKSLHPDET